MTRFGFESEIESIRSCEDLMRIRARWVRWEKRFVVPDEMNVVLEVEVEVTGVRVSGLVEVEAGVLAVEQVVGWRLTVGRGWRQLSSLPLSLVEVDVADVSPGPSHGLELDLLPPDAEESEAGGEEEEEDRGTEAEAEEAEGGGDPGGEREVSQCEAPLLDHVSLGHPAGDVTSVISHHLPHIIIIIIIIIIIMMVGRFVITWDTDRRWEDGSWSSVSCGVELTSPLQSLVHWM